MDTALVRRLKRAGKRVETLRFPNGTEVICLPYGGRVLGLFAAGDKRNFFWTNPALNRSATARKYFASEGWQNTGGERTWLGPELDFFFPNYPDMSVYHQPRPLDAGLFQVETTTRGLRLSNAFAIRSNRHRASLKIRLTKSVEPAADPLRNWPERVLMKGLHYAGYTQCTGLELIGASPVKATVGLWSLTQLPQGGEMILPTFGRANPRLFFGRIPHHDLTIRRGFVRCRMRKGSHWKFGFKAISATGRVGHRYEVSGTVQLVVRNFSVNLSGDYVDAPWADSSDTGFCVEICNVSDAGLGNFSELEYHAPAINGNSGMNSSEDCAQIWAYRGTREQIRSIAAKLLGASA